MAARSGGLVLAALLTTLFAAPAQADVIPRDRLEGSGFEEREFVCPLDGERFRQATAHPHFPLETFPDGSHPGDQWVEMQLPECPGNGLLLLYDTAQEAADGQPEYHTYTDAELARLPELLASEEWRALAGETRQLRGWWLADTLGLPVSDRFTLLLYAPWGTTDPARRRAALEVLVRELPALIDEAGFDPAQAGFARYYVINALRELGRFDEAAALLDQVEADTPGITAPDDPDSIYGPPGYAPSMRAAIAARDNDRYPVGLLSDDMAGRLCGSGEFADMRGRNAKARCSERAARIAHDEDVVQQSIDLLADPATLDAQCAATPEHRRAEGLAQACDHRDFQLATAEGDRLKEEEPAAVVAACAPRDRRQPETGMDFACIGYRTSLQFVIKRILVREDASYGALCEPQPMEYEEDEEIYLACSGAEDERAEVAALQLWQDLPALRRRCREVELNDRTHAEITACVWLEFHDESNPPPQYALESLDGPLHYNRFSELIVPQARALVDASVERRSRR